MGCEVYANGNEIACKAGDGKVIASFPDVCLTPPPPPAGPVPVPYPDTSFDRDMQNGSKTVQIKGQETMLKDQSFYKSSPLGNEAATNGQGASVITHVITGKTYFNAWSMDVQFEGQNVDRNIDLTTSNHASYPGATPPNPNLAKINAAALADLEAGKCPCCKGDVHSTGTPMNINEWYEKKNPGKKDEIDRLLLKATIRPGCTCTKPTKLVPEAPCDVFYEATKAEKDKIEEDWNNARPKYQKKNGIIGMENQAALFRRDNKRDATDAELREIKRTKVQVNHLTPKVAGGCPTAPGNLQPMKNLCPACQAIDGEFNKFQRR